MLDNKTEDQSYPFWVRYFLDSYSMCLLQSTSMNIILSYDIVLKSIAILQVRKSKLFFKQQGRTSLMSCSSTLKHIHLLLRLAFLQKKNPLTDIMFPSAM